MPLRGAEVRPELVSLARDHADDDVLDVVIELEQAPGSDESMQMMQESFEATKAPVETALEQAGASVVSEAWLNHTVRARVPAGALPALRSVEFVRALDVPHSIEPD